MTLGDVIERARKEKINPPIIPAVARVDEAISAANGQGENRTTKEELLAEVDKELKTIILDIKKPEKTKKKILAVGWKKKDSPIIVTIAPPDQKDDL